MEELNKIANDIALHTNDVANCLKSLVRKGPSNNWAWYKGSTPYASKRKKKRKK